MESDKKQERCLWHEVIVEKKAAFESMYCPITLQLYPYQKSESNPSFLSATACASFDVEFYHPVYSKYYLIRTDIFHKNYPVQIVLEVMPMSWEAINLTLAVSTGLER